MKKFSAFSAFTSTLLALAVLLPLRPVLADETDPGQISIAVGQLLERDHYTKRKLDNDLSHLFLKNFLDSCDYSHLFFTQKDIDAFNDKYSSSLGDDILLGNPTAAYEIWDVYTKRVEARVAKVRELLKDNKFTFASDRTMERDRSKAPWPKDEAEADQIWRDRVEGEFLQEKLLPHPVEPALKALTRRYDQLLKNVHEENRDDILKRFLDELAQTYDPHSEYMSKDDLASFAILMKNSLVGIGAVLQSDEGYAKIMDLVEGGPAKMSAKLKVGDRISAVAQGTDGEFVDVIDMKLDKVVDMIRGKKGTTVRLKVISAKSSDSKIVDIVRDEVKLKEQDAKAELIEVPDSNGQTRRLGWIRLPAFYSDMEHPDQKSTTKDVLALLNRLKQENISGLVMDLRNNGGGALDEAVNLTGLFVKKGPVVQTKDSNDNVHVSRCKDTEIAWDGPLVVLTNRLSASATEIFSAALQDYGRAVIVGDETTFGKGTVQTVVPIARAIPSFGGSGSDEDAGALKLTIQKFYRIAGGSTQLHGVSADVVIPSLWDIPSLYGEGALKGPLAYDVVDPASYDKVTDHPLFITELKQRSAARVAANPEFGYVTDDLARVKAKLAQNTISLNEKDRRAEDAADKERTDKREAARGKSKAPDEKIFEITLDNLDKPDLQPVKNDVKPAHDPDSDPGDGSDDADPLASKKPAVDPQKIETLSILNDLIDLSKPAKTASAATPTPATQ